jgi:hypothetical protein
MAHKFGTKKYGTTKYAAYLGIILSESVSMSDTVTKDSIKALSEFVFLLDLLSKQVLNKGLSESIQLIDWMTKNRDSETTWSD